MVLIKQIRFAGNEHQLRNYYTSGKYIDYITRQEATFNQASFINLNSLELINNLEKEKIKTQFSKLHKNQLVWDLVVSFEKDFCEKNKIYSVQDFSKAIKPSLEKLLETNNLNIEDLEIFGAFHQNTDNPHLHIGFFEKSEKYINRRGNKSFHKKGVLGGKDVKNFKLFSVEVEKFVEDDRLYSSLKNHREYLKNNLPLFNKDEIYAETISYFSKNNIKTFQFNKLNDEVKEKITNLVNHIIQNNEELKNQYNEYKNNLLELYNLKKDRLDNHKLNSSKLDEWYKLQDDDINVRNCNSILKSIKKDILSDSENNTSSNIILKTIESSINKNIIGKIKKSKHVSNSLSNNKFSLKAHKNSKAYIINNDFKDKQILDKIKWEISKMLERNKTLALKMYEQMRQDIKFEKIQEFERSYK
ncbi:MAG: relaxase MobL [Ureaplasma sp.]|nr:relaxase MobL [Ureaplasma sp.]